MKNQIIIQGGQNFLFQPVHNSGKSDEATPIGLAVKLAREHGIMVNDAVGNKWSPAGASFNDGGADFQAWLKSHGLELCKSDKSGAWWTVVKTSEVTKRDRKGIATNAKNKLSFSGI